MDIAHTLDANVPSETPVLVIIGADFSLRERIGAVSFSFVLRFQDAAPSERRLGEAAFVKFPENSAIVSHLPRRYPVIGYGPLSCMREAFDCGAADYLAEPWSLEEFELRTARILGAGTLHIERTALYLSGSVLGGPAGKILLSFDQAALLRQLIVAGSAGLSRGILRRYLWPSLGRESRNVDVAVSRLRKNLRLVSSSDSFVQLRSMRGIGYALVAPE